MENNGTVGGRIAQGNMFSFEASHPDGEGRDLTMYFMRQAPISNRHIHTGTRDVRRFQGGTGGMETKETELIAAEIATAAGVSTIITSSRTPASLFAILGYHGAQYVARRNQTNFRGKQSGLLIISEETS